MAELRELSDEASAIGRLCELNVIEQVANVCETTIVREAWQRGQPLTVHGWVYGIRDGVLRDLKITASDPDTAARTYAMATGQQRQVTGRY